MMRLLWTVTLVATACQSVPEVSIFVTSGFTDEVYQLDGTTGAILDTVAVNPRRHEADEPHGVAVAPAGDYWYATVAHGEPTLWKFELPTNRLVGMLPLRMSGAARIGVTPDGRRAFVPDYYRSGGQEASEVAVVRLTDLTVIERVALCPAPHDAQVDPTGESVAITCSKSDEVVVLDTRSLREVARFSVGETASPETPSPLGPLNVVWAPDGARMFVTLSRAAQVRAFTPRGERAGSVDVGTGPAQLAITPDGVTIVTANRGDRSVSLIDAAPLTERARIPIGGAFPHGVAIEPTGRVAYVTFEGATDTPGGVVAIDLAQGTVRWKVDAGVRTLGVAVAGRRR
jgi:YVTN family beta-propeller protein